MQLVVESRQVSLPSHRPTGARHWLGRWIWAETREGRKNHRVIFLVFLLWVCSEPCSSLQLIGFWSGTWVYLEVGGRCGVGE